MTPAAMTDLANTVLHRYATELADAADDTTFQHLAARAEGLYTTDLGARMRDLVDDARARRVITAGIGAQPAMKG